MAIFGGYSDKGFSNDLYFFDFISQRWERPITVVDENSEMPFPK
jgi:Galactose oxidase, central domain